MAHVLQDTGAPAARTGYCGLAASEAG